MCPLLLTAVGYFPKFVQEELSAGESHGRGNREKACLIMLYFPFSRAKNTAWENSGNIMPFFLPVQEKALIFYIAFV